jgi:hypothetical protein
MTKTIEEQEKPAKVWQINDLSEKIDALIETQKEIKQLIRDQSNTYPTKTELALELEKRDNKITALQKNIATYNKVVWLVVSTLIPVVVIIVWQLVVNSAKGQ